ncbi:MAG TPA: hypothetical protein PKD26_02275 [Pyrinomonadaceae bacterium]|nr:hypothetical protein [Pyrinomonadaceae bacterium]
MSVFEDLIDELKNEHLLEDTVIDLKRADAAARSGEGPVSEAHVDQSTSEGRPGSSVEAGATTVNGQAELDVPTIEEPKSEADFYRKRAMDEVSSLQMVDHVFSGVEREHLKLVPASFDELEAKKALHKFLQVAGDVQSPEHATYEYLLRQETEAWNFALYERDQRISVSSIRRFCEESRPVLSSQALISLARFYRNSPYSEEVRSKFDYIVTRLFSRDAGEGTRQTLFEHSEMIGHISTLYNNWSSIALYTSGDDKIDVSLTVTRFNEFRAEAASASSYDELLESDFFNRVRLYKETCAEMFYVPEVIASVVACNLTIGNQFVELISRERSRYGAEAVEQKYGFDSDQLVSSAAARTIALADVLQIEPQGDEPEPNGTVEQPEPAVAKPRPAKRVESEENSAMDLFGVNRWLLGICILCVLVSGGVYIWAERFAGGGESQSVVVAAPVVIDDAELEKYIKSPRSSKDTFYAVVLPSFDSLTEEEQKNVLTRAYRFAETKDLRKVNLLNKAGRTVAFASKNRFELVRE